MTADIIQRSKVLAGVHGGFLVTPVPYVGLGDILSGAKFFGGLRAYSFATIGTAAVRLRFSGDSFEKDYTTLTDGSLDVATIATDLITHGGSTFVTTVYDQTGNGNHMTQTTAGSQPQFLPNILGTFPAMLFASDYLAIASFNGGASLFAPYGIAAVSNRTSSTSTFDTITGGIQCGLFHSNAAGRIELEDSNQIQLTGVAENTWHAIQASSAPSGSSTIAADGASNTAAAAGSQFPGGGSNFQLGYGSDHQDMLNDHMHGYINEVCIWPVSLVSSISAINSNQHAYWGF